ncbi:MAG: hypothetical protein Q7U04_17075, partial [Bacteriovorax sp.]|nr:hypothetical protein [Bacteriovorax sp.]
MSIQISNTKLTKGFNYSKYIKGQKEENSNKAIQEYKQDPQKYMSVHYDYLRGSFNNLSDNEIKDLIIKDQEDRFSLGWGAKKGGMADEFNLNGSVNNDRLDTFISLELRKHDLQKDMKVNTRITRTIIDPLTNEEIKLNVWQANNGVKVLNDGRTINFKPSEVKQVSEVVIKPSIEFLFTKHSHWSYVYQLLNEEEKRSFEKMELETQRETLNEIVVPELKNSAGVHSNDVIFNSHIHLDNRDGLAMFHSHCLLSNCMRMEDGTMSSLQLDALNEKSFHDRLNSTHDNKFVDKFKARFPNIPLEAYSKNDLTITDKYQDIAGYRPALTEESRIAIAKQSKAKENIQIEIDKRTLKQRAITESKYDEVNEKHKLAGTTDTKAHIKEIETLEKNYNKYVDNLNSFSGRKKIHASIKQKKSKESITDKQIRLEDYAKSLDIRFKKEPMTLRYQLTDSEIMAKLTNTNSLFTK